MKSRRLKRVRSKKHLYKNKRKARKTYNHRNKTKTHRGQFKGGRFNEQLNTIKTTLETNFTINPHLSGVVKMECKNPDNCLALGPFGDTLKRYFNNFTDLSLINNARLKRLGAPSQNGFVIEVPFVKGGYTAFNALKCSSSEDSDNLFYEYYVGNEYINKQIHKLPCFVETYGCYYFGKPNGYNGINSPDKWDNLRRAARTKNFTNINLQSELTPYKFDDTLLTSISNSCVKNKIICIMIQHFDNARSLKDEYNDNFDNIKYDLYNLLYQVYFGLVQLNINPLTKEINKTYTHYDLHTGNVLLYKPFVGNKYITMRYHVGDLVYEFNTEYICKIIDYGRNYIKLPNGEDTNTFLTNPDYGVCKISRCNSDYAGNCGADVGYEIIQGNAFDPAADFYNIMPNIPNMSHDMRLAMGCREAISILTDDIIYNQSHLENNNVVYYGTPELMDDHVAPGKIKNIFDLKERLENILGHNDDLNFNATHNDKKYATWVQAGIIDVYDDGQNYAYTKVATEPTPASSLASTPSSTPSSSSVSGSPSYDSPSYDSSSYVSSSPSSSPVSGSSSSGSASSPSSSPSSSTLSSTLSGSSSSGSASSLASSSASASMPKPTPPKMVK